MPSDPELAEWLLEDLGAEKQEDEYVATVAEETLVLQIRGTHGEADETADVRVGLLRFVDVLTLQAMEESLRAESDENRVPTVILIYRNENEVDFKMSCPYCGQKLWVRDADQDKRGRCPHCRKGFTLPAQEQHVASALRLKNRIPVHRVVHNDPGTFGAPLRAIVGMKGSVGALDHLEMDSAVASNQTMNVDVEDTEPGAD